MYAGLIILVWLVSYLLGAIPFGLLVARWFSGRDVRQVESGRTGGTNVMRTAGFTAGLTTAILDILKGAAAVWLVKAVLPEAYLVQALAPVWAILGHNYSIFLAEKNEQGRWRLRGGAGGATSLGGAIGLWWPSVLIIFPLAVLIFFGVGYASVTTMSVAFLALVLFAIRYALGVGPWQYIVYGVLAEILVIWALRPNIQRLRNGTERLHGWRAKRKERLQQQFRDDTSEMYAEYLTDIGVPPEQQPANED